MSAQPLPHPGQLVGGKYRMVRVIGHGAMGAVYEAQQVATGKRVAVKWLHPHIMQSRSAVERLVREAQASARVRHSNVVDVYDVEREGNTLFLVMEYLEGEPLSSLIERGGVPFHELLTLIVQAMRGVAEAHRQGIVHRDIKPDNIFLAYQTDQPRPIAKVLDFGISKLDSPPGELSLTQTGSTLGTPLYMSYEQLSGVRDIDGRSDIYSFGVILYEALTGTLPFNAENFADLAAKVITSEPAPPRQIRPDIPEPLERIIQHAMRRRREERPPHLGVVIDSLLPYTVPASEVRLSVTSPGLPSARVSRSQVVPASVPPHSVPPHSMPPRAAGPSSMPPAGGVRLRTHGDWDGILERERRSQREMEDSVTSLIAGTIPDSIYPSRKKRSSRRGLWIAAGAGITLVSGLAIGAALRDDRGKASAPPAAPVVASPAPKQAEPAPSVAPPPQAPAPAAHAEPAPAAQPEAAEQLEAAAPTQVEPMPLSPAEVVKDSGLQAPKVLSPARPGARAAAPAAPARRWRPSGEEEVVQWAAPPPPPPPAELPVEEPAPEVQAPARATPGGTPPNPFLEEEPSADEATRYRAGRPREDEF